MILPYQMSDNVHSIVQNPDNADAGVVDFVEDEVTALMDAPDLRFAIRLHLTDLRPGAQPKHGRPQSSYIL